MSNKNRVADSWLMNPTLLLTYLQKSQIDKADGFRIQFFDGGFRVEQGHHGKWHLVDTITMDSERIHQALDVARYFGWPEFEKLDQVLATAWNRVELGPQNTVCQVWLRKNEGKHPEITVWHSRPTTRR